MALMNEKVHVAIDHHSAQVKIVFGVWQQICSGTTRLYPARRPVLTDVCVLRIVITVMTGFAKYASTLTSAWTCAPRVKRTPTTAARQQPVPVTLDTPLMNWMMNAQFAIKHVKLATDSNTLTVNHVTMDIFSRQARFLKHVWISVHQTKPRMKLIIHVNPSPTTCYSCPL